MTTPKKQSGYTLLFAVLVSVLVLGVAVFITGIARKQYILSSTALDSVYSLYAADSGVECLAAAEYGGNSGHISTSTGSVVQCSGATYTLAFHTPPSGNVPVPSSFSGSPYQVLEAGPFNIGLSGGTCAVAYVFDGYSLPDPSNPSSLQHMTIVDSRGYNVCISATHTPDTTSPRTVERALRWSVSN